MNYMSVTACLWFLGGTLLTYGLPANLTNTNVKERRQDEKCLNCSAVGPPSSEPNAVALTNGAEHPSIENVEDSPRNEGPNSSLPTITAKTTDTTPSSATTSAVTPTTIPPIITTPNTPTPTPNATSSSTTEKPTESTIPSTTSTTLTSTPSTIPSSIVPISTKAPPPTKTPPPETDRRFDGPSFIGGIVLAFGVTAIGFIAWKFYKARTERNYHTL